MSGPETLAAIVAALDVAGIEHMVAGSFASSLHSVARTTVDSAGIGRQLKYGIVDEVDNTTLRFLYSEEFNS